MKLSGCYFFKPIYGCAKFRWKIKYAIYGGNWTFVKHLFYYWMDRIEIRIKILTDIKIWFKKKQTFSQSAQ
jgi:hypothetical protein